jgi:hypothetical protein
MDVFEGAVRKIMGLGVFWVVTAGTPSIILVVVSCWHCSDFYWWNLVSDGI